LRIGHAILNLFMKVIGAFTSTLNNSFLRDSFNRGGLFIPSTVPSRSPFRGKCDWAHQPRDYTAYMAILGLASTTLIEE
uniref:Uncharacterized protein n=1 Tax=Apteryx owenii TaxID=8824 RepID=A0A8B9PIM9_APTOW